MKLTTFLDVERRGAILIVRPLRNIGCFANSELQDEWYDLLQCIDDPRTRDLVLDFGGIAYFGSTILEMMLLIGKRLKSRQGRMVICDLSQLGREIVAVARFRRSLANYQHVGGGLEVARRVSDVAAAGG